MDKSFRLSGPFADELMQEAEDRVKTRGYTSEELADAAIPAEYDLVFDPPHLILEFLRVQSNVNYHNALRINGIKGLVKKWLFKLFGWFVVPAFDMQNAYNQAAFHAMEDMCNEIEILKNQIEQLKERT